VVTITTPTGQGSGVLVDPSGVVVTNLHVVEGQTAVTVRLANGDAYDGPSVRAFDERKDLVLLKITGFKLPSVQLGDSDLLNVGQAVYAIGSPKGFELTLSEGIVSGVRDTGDGYRVIQTSAAISAGSSGGGLFDSSAKLVGVTSFKVRGGENLNFALPINYVQGMLSSTSNMTLEDFARRARSSGVAPVGATTDATGQSVPRLATALTNGNAIAVVEQDGANVRVSFTNTGYVYGSGTLTWDPKAKAFVGDGTLDVRCGAIDTRIWKAPIKVEIYVVNSAAIRERWTNPNKVNCGRGTVESSTWQEMIWVASK
jgi:S1-C subfamily serine protease